MSDEVLGCYSRLYTREVEVERPRSVDELKDSLLRAADARRRVTFRSGGMSFDRQALNGRAVDDPRPDSDAPAPRVVCLAGWNRVLDIDDEGRTVCVEPGAKWRDIMHALLRRGLVPAVTVTTGDATAGGTLSANALSRFSSAYGKEGTWVVEAEIVTPDGRCRVCRPPPRGRPAEALSAEERLFMGAVGGLGYVGAFTKITYRVLRAPEPRVKTVVRRFWGLRGFADAIAAAACQAEQERSDPSDPTKRDAIYGAVHTGRWLRQAMLFTSNYTCEKGEPMPIHQPDLPLRPYIDLALSTPVKPLIWLYGFAVLPRRRGWVDPIEPFAFFQDGSRRTMDLLCHHKLVQQTFVIPRPALAAWLRAAARRLRRARVRPILEDIVALPKDRPFCLSVTPDGPAFGVTYTFLVKDRRRKIERIATVLGELSELAWREYRGRVSLVKNVFADAETVQAMFGSKVDAFASLREEVGAKGVLTNDLFDTTLSRGPGAGGTRPAPDGG
jgi:decaprenylphospho-beta-D-ribofuranose 2-oxidase